MSNLTIYKASAGSGKTYTLTGEYISLLFENPNNYSSTLAVTFTNKATAEMRGRILNKLYEIYKNETNDYVDDLKRKYNISEEEVRQRAHKILSNLLHDFSNFSVSTIDSFFQKIIKSFAREAGLDSNFKIELNTSDILQQAINKILMKLDLPENKYLKQWVADFTEKKIQDGKAWNIESDLKSLGEELFKELYQDNSLEMEHVLRNKEEIISYRNDLKSITTTFENNLKKIGEAALEVIKGEGLQIKDFAYKGAGTANCFQKLSFGEPLEMGVRIKKIYEGEAFWYAKTAHKEVKNRISNIEYILNDLLNKTIEYQNTDLVLYNTATIVLRNFYSFGIIADIADEVNNITSDENIFLISNSSSFLNKIIGNNNAPFIYEKIGTHFNNFMIDEFQDTSKLQWQNFRPLIENSLSQNYKSLIVGDVKQSIYRWRNSDWRLLGSKVQEEFNLNENQIISLDYNWRSNDNIIKFNNTVFSFSAEIIQNLYNNIISGAYNERELPEDLNNLISKAYDTIHQHIPEHKKTNSGYVFSRFYEKNKDIDKEELVLTETIKQIEYLISKGYKYKDVCILVRSKAEGLIITQGLLSGNYSEKNTSIPVISEKSLFISTSSAVNFIISQIKYIQTPKDLILKSYIVLQKQLFEDNIENEYINIQDYYNFNDTSTIKDANYKWIDDLMLLKQKPLIEIIEILAHNLPDKVKKEQSIFIQAYINYSNSYIKDNYPDINSYMEWWDEKGVEQIVELPEDHDAIKIMTIHRSKGLEFKVVIIPFCNWPLVETNKRPLLWCKSNIVPFNKIPIIPINYSSKLEQTLFCDDYYRETLLQCIDNINLLYVALTRACEVIITLGETSNANNLLNMNVADLMCDILSNKTSDDDEKINVCNYWNSEGNFFEYGQVGNITEEDKEINNISLKPFENRKFINSNISIKSESSDFFSSDESTESINHGNIMHSVFENIITLNDIDNAVNKLHFEGKMSATDMSEIKDKIQSYITDDRVKQWFNPDNIVKNENTILANKNQYRPDRVVYINNEVHIIDYKESPKIVRGFVWYVEMQKIIEI